MHEAWQLYEPTGIAAGVEGMQLVNIDAVGESFSAEMEKFVNRDLIQSKWSRKHQVLVGMNDWIIGHGVVDQGNLLSRFPRTGWRFSLNS